MGTLTQKYVHFITTFYRLHHAVMFIINPLHEAQHNLGRSGVCVRSMC